ncbi:hypothetical protein T4D_15821 [Trichinella pseudospiralis]|uniref:Uncharacterized protein n=1 Tax=Trichinella pseudospiralis TaxID=6337 RepID=A0A0V1F722_TRIPS|nr:hypothetical protein T4D_15821 [Trichinella pseudospiralis]
MKFSLSKGPNSKESTKICVQRKVLETHESQRQMLDMHTKIMRTSEHAEGCRLDHQQLNELKRLAAEDLRPVWEIYDELASSASTSLDTAAYFPDFYTAQARNTMYYSRAKRYPRLPAMRQDLRLTAEPTTTKSGCWLRVTAGAEMGHLRLSYPGKIFPRIAGYLKCSIPKRKNLAQLSQHPGARLFLPLLPSCASAAVLPVSFVLAGFDILNVGTSRPVEALSSIASGCGFQPLKFRFGMFIVWLCEPTTIWNCLQLIIDGQPKAVTVVRQMDDGYMRGRGSVRCSAAYGD